jgi:hypothetical protein
VADAAGGARDQDGLSRLEPAAVEERLPRRHPGHRDPSGLLVADAGGLPPDLAGGGGGQLGVGAALGHAEHLVARREPVGARELDRARGISPEHDGQRRVKQPPAHLPVDRVHGRGADPYQHLAVTRLRIVDFLEAQDVRIARLVHHHCSHDFPSLKVPARRYEIG